MRLARASTGERLIVADAIDDADLLALGSARQRAPAGDRRLGHRHGAARRISASGPARWGRKSFCGRRRPCHRPVGQLLGGDAPADRRLSHAASIARASMPADALEAWVLHSAAPSHSSSRAATGSAGLFDRGPRGSRGSAGALRRASARRRLRALFRRPCRASDRPRASRRLVVAGGETSGAVASAFGPIALEVGPEIDTGVPRAGRDRRAALGFGAEVGQFRRRRFLREGAATC